MNEDIKLNDISDELLILNKITIDTLFQLENCSDCIALYIFYYKTAKWQKTNIIKATDKYTRACLKWSTNKILKIKTILKENGLIDIIQRRSDGKIKGWYIQVNYLINTKKRDELKIKVEESKNLNFQELEFSRTCNQETNALKEYIICLKKEIDMLKNNNKENISNNKLLLIKERYFNEFWKLYPRKVEKKDCKEIFYKLNFNKEEEYEFIIIQLKRYKDTEDWNKENGKFIPYPKRWLSKRRWEDEFETITEHEQRLERELENGIEGC